ncbi:hypothetical protein UlMin_038325 [Ulmus minor]
MTGIDPAIAVHRLQVDPDHPPVKQKRRKIAPERNKAVNEEIQKLLDIGSVREVHYPDWLANVVVVRKKNAGKFLGYMVTQRGIEANPDQIRSIMNLQSPACIRDVQRLTGRVAALSRFISRSSEKCHLFFSTLRKSKDFEWTPACEQALHDLKRYLTSPPLLSKPKDGEQLYIYLAVSEGAVSAVLLEKLALALVTAARKLRPYFQCHPITVYTTYPLKSILHKPELSGRLTKWTVELSEYDITFQPRTALKSQVLADFVADFAPNATQQADKELLNLTERSVSKWTLTVDGSSNVNGAGIGLVLTSPEGDLIQQAIRCGFKATNNEAEYEALIAGLNLAKDMGIKKLSVRSDSQLVTLQPAFEEFDISQIPRADNSHADALANLGSSIPATESQTIPLLYLQWPAVWKDPPAEVTTIDASDSWLTPIVRYLTSDELPEDKNEARRLRAKAARFTIHDGKLLKRSFSGPYLRCVTPVVGGQTVGVKSRISYFTPLAGQLAACHDHLQSGFAVTAHHVGST